MISQKVVFQPPAQMPRLKPQAVQHLRIEFIAFEVPLDPVHNAQRGGVGLPTVALTGRVFQDPPTDPLLLPRFALLRIRGAQIVKVMEVIEPELVPLRVIPILGLPEHFFLVQEQEMPGTQQAPGFFCTFGPMAGFFPASRQVVLFDCWAVNAAPEAPIDLNRLKVANGVPILRDFHSDFVCILPVLKMQ